MKLFNVGYYLGYYSTDIVILVTKTTLAVKGYRKVGLIAKNHKIDSTNPEAVADNLMKCLEFIDW